MSGLELGAALRSRLLEAAPVLLTEISSSELSSLTDGQLLRGILESARDSTRRAAWLAYVAIAGAFPVPTQLDDFESALRLASDSTLVKDAVTSIDIGDRRHRRPDREITVVQNVVIADVNFCATHAHNTGIQRVVRSVMPVWRGASHPHLLVAWTDDDAGYRELTEVERARVVAWTHDAPRVTPQPPEPGRIIVPWGATLFLPEVPQYAQCGPIVAMAEAGVVDVDLIGYDVIPITSADSVAAGESERFAIYLDVVKHARSVLAISDTVAAEFEGFVAALPTQGLTGPVVHSVPLAVDVPAGARDAAAAARGTADIPIMVCVGSHEPRKNQEAVLFAAERMHREGHELGVVFVGGGNRVAYADFDRRVRRLRRAGMRVESHRRLDDDGLWRLYGRARFTVFISLHEGFGLPAAESLAVGTPVLVSDSGSLAEIATLGGCLTVDPRDDEAIADGMRRMLEDDELIARLQDEAMSAPTRSWSQYAERLWQLVGKPSAA